MESSELFKIKWKQRQWQLLLVHLGVIKKGLVGPARRDSTMINERISARCSFMVAAGEMEITLKQ